MRINYPISVVPNYSASLDIEHQLAVISTRDRILIDGRMLGQIITDAIPVGVSVAIMCHHVRNPSHFVITKNRLYVFGLFVPLIANRAVKTQWRFKVT